MDVIATGTQVTAVEDEAATGRVVKRPRFHALPVKAVIKETPDAVSIVFDVPSELEGAFVYRAGQFVTFRLEVSGEEEQRSYSMSSTPGVDPDLQVTVKRVPNGLVSNWLVDNVQVGDSIEISEPSGLFVLPDRDQSRDVTAFAAGSGITPIFSIIKSVVRDSNRSIRMIYANRDRSSAIFHRELRTLQADFPDRVRIIYSIDEDDGPPQPGMIADLLGNGLNAEFYVCGPKGFMDMVTTTLVWCGVRSDQLHVELFSPDDVEGEARPTSGAVVTVTLNGRTATIAHRAEWTIVQAARTAGLKVPTSCHLGQCGTCMARVTEGAADMTNNQVLTADEVAEGWILTCQAKPATPRLSVVYE
jgi:ferredoxin-NADP reductase